MMFFYETDNEYGEVSHMPMRLEMFEYLQALRSNYYYEILCINNNVNDLGFVNLRMVFIP